MLNKLKIIISSHPFFSLSKFWFNLLFALFMLLAYNLPFAQKLWSITPSFWFTLGGIICTYLLLCIATTILFNKYTLKPLSIVLCLLNSFVFYFMITYNTPIDKIMFLNALQTDIYEVQDLLGLRMLCFVIFLGLLPAWLIFKTKINFDGFKKNIIKSMLTIVISGLICAAILLGNLSTTDNFFRNHRDAKYYLTPINYMSASIAVLKMRNNSSHEFVTIANDAKFEKSWKNNKKNLFVFVVGETARAANFSLRGYNRPTNAPLNKYLKDIIYYQDASSCGTSTSVSLPCMFSKDGRNDYEIGSEEYSENLLDVLKKTGYKVLWRENNTGCKNNCDRVEIEDFCTKKTCFDEILLTNFANKVTSFEKNTFVVMHQTGSHGPAYFAHYPKEAEIYQPVCQTENLSSCTIEELVNVYDNTVYYTSVFLGKLIEELQALSKEYNVALFYASDHGESLGENGIYLHAQPYENAPIYQKDVPMFIWLPEETAQNLSINRQCLQKAVKKPHSHDNLFHSVLGLSDIKTTDYHSELDVFSTCRQP